MKKNEVKIGKTYTAKVTDKVVPVRIDAAKGTGWSATNLATGKKIYVKSAQRLRGEYTGKAKPAGKKTPAPDPKAAPITRACVNCGSRDIDAGGTCNKCHEPKARRATPKAKGGGAATTSPTSPTDAKRAAGAAKPAKDAKVATRAKQGKPKANRPSGLNAAARVLAESKKPLNAKEIVEIAFAKGYWKSSGKTPHATVYSAMIREIAAKGKEARFKKTERGKFARNA